MLPTHKHSNQTSGRRNWLHYLLGGIGIIGTCQSQGSGIFCLPAQAGSFQHISLNSSPQGWLEASLSVTVDTEQESLSFHHGVGGLWAGRSVSKWHCLSVLKGEIINGFLLPAPRESVSLSFKVVSPWVFWWWKKVTLWCYMVCEFWNLIQCFQSSYILFPQSYSISASPLFLV